MEIIKGNCELRVWGAEIKCLSPHILEVESVVACSWYGATESCRGGDWNYSYCDVAT